MQVPREHTMVRSTRCWKVAIHLWPTGAAKPRTNDDLRVPPWRTQPTAAALRCQRNYRLEYPMFMWDSAILWQCCGILDKHSKIQTIHNWKYSHSISCKAQMTVDHSNFTTDIGGHKLGEIYFCAVSCAFGPRPLCRENKEFPCVIFPFHVAQSSKMQK